MLRVQRRSSSHPATLALYGAPSKARSLISGVFSFCQGETLSLWMEKRLNEKLGDDDSRSRKMQRSRENGELMTDYFEFWGCDHNAFKAVGAVVTAGYRTRKAD